LPSAAKLFTWCAFSTIYWTIPRSSNVAEQMCDHVTSRYGEQTPNIVIVEGDSKETLRLFGESHAVTRARPALFDAAVRWSPLQPD